MFLGKSDVESQNIFIHCPFARRFENSHMNSFRWYLVSTSNVKGFLCTMLLGHPFEHAKALLWSKIARDFFGFFGKNETKEFSRKQKIP